jgi:hypothetical protein
MNNGRLLLGRKKFAGGMKTHSQVALIKHLYTHKDISPKKLSLSQEVEDL